MATSFPHRHNKSAPPIEPIGLSPREAARLLGISQKLLWNQTKAGKIPSTKIGARVIYSRQALLRAIEPKGCALAGGAL